MDGGPMLYDAVLTGCTLPYAEHTFDKYTDKIGNDIKK